MKSDEERQALITAIHKLLLRDYVQKDNDVVTHLNELLDDIKKDFFTIVVLGEFKRGKSTFVNALIGMDLLPADVLPTTATINALMYDDKKQVHVVMQDGSVEKGKATKEYLSQFSAGKRNDAEKVKFIEIGCQAPILENKVVIVDTPGVSDINEQRVQVTYDFIPKANAVIFLLDATAPLKKTEKDFIEAHLLSIGLDNIIFIANKYDEIDEEEDEDIIRETKNRMIKAFKDKQGRDMIPNIEIVPLSAKMALQGIIHNQKELIDDSGIIEVKKRIERILSEGTMTLDKMKRYKARLQTIIEVLQHEIKNEIEMQALSQEDLQAVIEHIHALLDDYENNKKSVDAYVEQEKKTIIAMTDKSLILFHKRLKEDITDQIEGYNGADFKEFIENHVNKQLKRSMENWVDTYSGYIDQLLIHLERSLAQGMAVYFNAEINLHSGFQTGTITSRRFDFQLDAVDVSGATVQAGAISAGGAGLVMLIGGPIMMPLVGFLAYPFLQKKFLKSKLEEAREEILPVLNDVLLKTMYNLQHEVHQSISERVSCIQENTNRTYQVSLEKMRVQLESIVQEKKNMNVNVQAVIDTLQENINELDDISHNL
jgi:GTPase SAR1 family protein